MESISLSHVLLSGPGISLEVEAQQGLAGSSSIAPLSVHPGLAEEWGILIFSLQSVPPEGSAATTALLFCVQFGSHAFVAGEIPVPEGHSPCQCQQLVCVCFSRRCHLIFNVLMD